MKTKRVKQLLAILLSLLMLAAVTPLPASAEGTSLTYIKRVWDAESETVIESKEPVPGPLRSFPGECEGGGWYYIAEDKVCNNRVTIPNNAVVNLVLGPGVTLECKNGIYVSKSSTLNVYGQSDDSGTLKATGSDGNSGIGGNEDGAHGAINIYGGTVDATGGSHGAGIGTGEDAEGACGAICIFGGNITARGGEYGAGIGGGDESTGAQIEILGGKIDATGGDKGAGIGGGCDRGPSLVTIRGGKIDANGGKYGAGIGEGYDASSDSSSGTIIIRNCEKISAEGGLLGAGIGGGGYNNTKINIHIFGGKDIDAYGGDCNDCGAAGIGAGAYREVSDLFGGGGDFGGSINISGGNVFASGSGCFSGSAETNCGAAGIGAGYGGNMTGSIAVSGGVVNAEGAYGGAAIGAGAEDTLGAGGECEDGHIMILGGLLNVWTTFNNKEKKAVVIGHGYDGDDNGELTFGPTMLVRKSDETTVAIDRRVSTCQTETGRLYISECEHEHSNYAPNSEQTHIRTCETCLLNIEEEHFFFEGSCACGAEGCGVFFFDGDDLIDTRMSYGLGGKVVPPADPQKTGLIFGGWYPYLEDGFETPYDFDLPINEDVFLKARWLLTFKLSVYDRTTGTFGVGGKVSTGYPDDYGTHKEITVDPGSFADAVAKADDGYDFVGWAYCDTLDTIYIPTTSFSISITENEHFCAVFEKHVHTLRFVSGYDPECEYDGEIDHYKCTKCRKLFSDENGLNEITEDDIKIPAIHHDWDEPNYEWSEDYSELTARRVCRNDGDHVEYEIVEVSSEVTKEPTCEGKGETTYTSAAFENEAFEAQSVTVEDIDPSGHDFGAWTKLDENSHQRLCSRDAGHVETGDHAWDEGIVSKEASCTAEGEMTYTCTVCGATMTETIGLIRHVSAPAVKENEVPATCTSEGSYDSVIYCRNCPTELRRETVIVEKADHTPETVPGKSATCTEDGLTDGVACSVCGKVFTAQEIIPATGNHVDGNGDGKCDNCGAKINGQDDGLCKWCGKDHSGSFRQKIVGFFHRIFYFFAHLFGLR